MQYMGGKNKIRKEISSFLESVREGRDYFEPFVGGGWILQEMTGKRYASDINPYLIQLYKSLQNGWEPPSVLSEDEYKEIKRRMDVNDPMTAFAGFCCSFGGKWFGGYARNRHGDNYAKSGRSSLLKQNKKFASVIFACRPYSSFNPKGMLVYCDPPYKGTTEYSATTKFDHELYYKTMVEWSENNVVVMSEYEMTSDFVCVKEIPTKSVLKIGTGIDRIERLFMVKGHERLLEEECNST